MGDESAVDDLIRVASDPAVLLESVHKAFGRVLAGFSPHDRAGAERALGRIADEIIDAPTRPDVAGPTALHCGALVERGLDPNVAIASILNRLERQIAPDAIAFVAACREAEADGPQTGPVEGGDAKDGAEEQQADPVQKHGERLGSLMPTESQSFHALEPMALAAIAMLSRSREARKASRSRTALRASLDELGGQYGYAGFLWTMFQVLDDEPVVVLHPGQGKGYRVRISGLADNFQLHTLLADALVGRFSSQWLRARRPSRSEVAIARDAPLRDNAPPARGVFNLWTWKGLKPDATLSDAMSGSANWVWNEGVPADIPPFEGTRVVLLGPPPYERSWNCVRKFPSMNGDLRLEAVLSADETRDYLNRIAAAVAAG